MKRFEYKIQYLTLGTDKSNEEQIVEALNGFGQEGWRLSRLSGEVSLRNIMSWRGGLNFLLERELPE